MNEPLHFNTDPVMHHYQSIIHVDETGQELAQIPTTFSYVFFCRQLMFNYYMQASRRKYYKNSTTKYEDKYKYWKKEPK